MKPRNAPKTSSDVWSVWFRLISFDSQDSFEPASVFPSFHPPRSVVRNFLGAHLETSAQGQWHGWRKNGGAISEEIAGRSCMTWTWKKNVEVHDSCTMPLVTVIKPHTTAAARQGQFLIAAAWQNRQNETEWDFKDCNTARTWIYWWGYEMIFLFFSDS